LTTSDTYKTLIKPSEETIFKDRGSKFIAYAYPLQHESQVKIIIANLKNDHHKARHWCYAWQIGVDDVKFRVNDDGEPNNSAGQPIYGQILSKEITNVLVVVVRYFGGTKLGVGGLVNAYKSAAQMTLEASTIVAQTVKIHFELIFDYQYMNSVMRIIREYNMLLVKQKMDLQCEFEIAIRKNEAENVKRVLAEIRHIKVRVI